MSRPSIATIARQAVSALRAEPIAGPSGSRRSIASVAHEHSKTSPTPYPFSSRVVFPTPIAEKPVQPNLLAPKKGWSLITHLESKERPLRDPQSLHATLFSRRHKNRVLPGSILTVTSYNNSSRSSTSAFSGVLMGVSRGGLAYSFRLRNVVNKVGVEIQYNLFSPMIKEIRIVKRAERAPSKGGIKAFRQAKAFYLRDRPELLRQLAGAVKNDAAKAEKEARLTGRRK